MLNQITRNVRKVTHISMMAIGKNQKSLATAVDTLTAITCISKQYKLRKAGHGYFSVLAKTATFPLFSTAAAIAIKHCGTYYSINSLADTALDIEEGARRLAEQVEKDNMHNPTNE